MEEHELQKLIDSVKRNCKMCYTYKNFYPHCKERPIVEASLKTLYNAYLGMYDKLRTANASGKTIMDCQHNRRLMLDASDVCKQCQKDLDHARQMVKGIRLV